MIATKANNGEVANCLFVMSVTWEMFSRIQQRDHLTTPNPGFGEVVIVENIQVFNELRFAASRKQEIRYSGYPLDLMRILPSPAVYRGCNFAPRQPSSAIN